MSCRNRLYRYELLLATLVLLGLSSGCETGDTTDPTPDDGMRIAGVEVERAILAPGDSTDLRVWVVRGDDNPSPVEGVPVVFAELLQQVEGTFSKTESVTNAAGWAASTYHPGGTAERTVTLKISAASDIEYVQLQVITTPFGGFSGANRAGGNAPFGVVRDAAGSVVQ